MNYRHAFHAGSFADVVKHAILARILVYLERKASPFRFIDTHAGAGRYDLDRRRRGARPNGATGIARLLKASPPQPCRGAARALPRGRRPPTTTGRRPRFLPGSPAIAQALLRADDRIALCEAHPEEREKLIAALGRDHRLSIVGTDGYVALDAYLPPKERRGSF